MRKFSNLVLAVTVAVATCSTVSVAQVADDTAQNERVVVPRTVDRADGFDMGWIGLAGLAGLLGLLPRDRVKHDHIDTSARR